MLPYSTNGGSTNVAFDWHKQIQPYIKNRQVLTCPSQTTNKDNGYAYNFVLGGGGRSIADIKIPAQTPSWANAVGRGTSGNVNEALAFIIITASPGARHDGRRMSFPNDDPQYQANGWSGDNGGRIRADIHSDGANYAFCDGHVKWLHYVKDTNTANVPAAASNAPPKLNLDYNADGTVGNGDASSNIPDTATCGSTTGGICGGWS